MSIYYAVLVSSVIGSGQGFQRRDRALLSDPIGVLQSRHALHDGDVFLRPQAGSSVVQISAPHTGFVVESFKALAIEPSLGNAKYSGSAQCENCKATFDYQWILQTSPYPGISFLALLIWACVLIWLIGTTAQDFFVPPLLYWSERLRLQPEVAGATLLALGNGAPDIFAVSTAASRMDLSLALSEMFGSNMFTLCLTGAAVVVACHSQVSSAPFIPKYTKKLLPKVGGYGIVPLRVLPKLDIGLLRLTVIIYLVTLAAIGFVLLDGQPSLAKASCLPLLYAFYLMAVMCHSRRGHHLGDEEEDPTNGDQVCTEKANLPSQDETTHSETLHEKERDPISRMWWVLTSPAHFARGLSIPTVDGKWDNRRRIVSSICVLGMLAFSVFTNFARWQALACTWQLSIAATALVVSIIILVTGGSGPALPWFYPFLTILAQASAICWLAATAGELTALIEAAGFVFEVPQISLGFTAIAWGDALGDMLTCVAMVRSGQARAAMMAVFANSVLDDLLGFGLALVSMTSEAGGGVALWKQSQSREVWSMMITSFGFLAGAVAILVMMIQQRGLLPQVWVGALLLLYIAFLASVVKSEG